MIREICINNLGSILSMMAFVAHKYGTRLASVRERKGRDRTDRTAAADPVEALRAE
jgi:hypothetical protein